MRVGIVVVVVVVVVATAGAARADHPPLTHTTPLSPTGELLAPGDAEYTQSVVFVHHDVALGIADGLEVRLGMPLVPLPVLGGDLQVRVSPLPAAWRLRAVIGAGVIAEWINGADAWTTASATIAWRGDRWSAHATVRIADRAAWTNVGATWRAGAITTVFAELGRFAWASPDGACTDKHGASIECATRSIDGAVVGAWFQLHDVAIGLSAALAHHGDTVLPILPLLSIRHDRDL